MRRDWINKKKKLLSGSNEIITTKRIDNNFIEQFKFIIAHYGKALLEEPKRLEAFLKDYCPGNKKEINLIISILKDGILKDLKNLPGNEISEFDCLRLVKKVAENTWIAEEGIKAGVLLVFEVSGKNVPNLPGIEKPEEKKIILNKPKEILTPNPAIIYDSVKIGNQIWMTKNLDVDKFRNGDLIPEVRSNADWILAGKNRQPAWCYYDNDPENGKKYGKLYNWFAVTDPRGLALKGWHIPGRREHENLIHYVNENGNFLKATGQGEGTGAGTNISGFCALLAGYRQKDGTFKFINCNAYFGSKSIDQLKLSCCLYLNYYDKFVDIYNLEKTNGLSIRCVKDI